MSVRKFYGFYLERLFKDRSVVWKGKSKINDSKFSISENFSRDTEFNRKNLYAIYKKRRTWRNRCTSKRFR